MVSLVDSFSTKKITILGKNNIGDINKKKLLSISIKKNKS